MTEPTLRLCGRELACRRGGRVLFSGLSFEVAAGEMLMLRGPNGVGKTSLLRLVAGFLAPVSGTVVLQGGRADTPLAQQCHFIAHQNAIKPQLSVEENLRFWLAFLGAGEGSLAADENVRLEEAIAALRLQALRHLPGGVLSAGQKRRLALARIALAPRPVWLLDEPTVGLDTDSQAALCELMRRHLEGGGIIIASTHVDFGMPATRTLEMRPPEQPAAVDGEDDWFGADAAAVQADDDGAAGEGRA